jgi:hypothetical protein
MKHTFSFHGQIKNSGKETDIMQKTPDVLTHSRQEHSLKKEELVTYDTRRASNL